MFGFGRAMPVAAVPLWPLKRKFGEHIGHRESIARDRGAATHSACKYPALTAFPPLRKLAPGRNLLARGSGLPLSASELQPAMDFVRRDVHAASTIGPMEAKVRTIRKVLACFGLPLL